MKLTDAVSEMNELCEMYQDKRLDIHPLAFKDSQHKRETTGDETMFHQTTNKVKKCGEQPQTAHHLQREEQGWRQQNTSKEAQR